MLLGRHCANNRLNFRRRHIIYRLCQMHTGMKLIDTYVVLDRSLHIVLDAQIRGLKKYFQVDFNFIYILLSEIYASISYMYNQNLSFRVASFSFSEILDQASVITDWQYYNTTEISAGNNQK